MKKGFTLVELLLVIGIIGILTAIVISSTDAARVHARDSKRISDIKEIQLGLAVYYDVNRAYPTALSSLTSQKFLPDLPTDPLGASYEYIGSNTTYCIGTTLENTSDAPVELPSASCTSSASSTANYKAMPTQ